MVEKFDEWRDEDFLKIVLAVSFGVLFFEVIDELGFDLFAIGGLIYQIFTRQLMKVWKS